MARYWLSYDLGLRGNYEQLYEWLDRLDARECGEAMATFESEKTREQIKSDLGKLLGKSARVYLIGKKASGKFTGSFILGRRRRSSWQGYAVMGSETEEEE